MKKRLIVLAGLSFILCACQKTPQDVIVRQKNGDNIANYQNGEENEGSIREVLNIPTHYTKDVYDEDGNLMMKIDADVTVPDVTSIDTISVTAKSNDETFDTVIQAFCGDADFYPSYYEEDGESYRYDDLTKADLQERITLIEKYLQAGNFDPFHLGVDEYTESYVIDLESELSLYREKWKEASEEKVVFEKIIPQLEEDKNGGVYSYIVAETENGVYDISAYALNPSDNTFQIYFQRQHNEELYPFQDQFRWTRLLEDPEHILSEETLEELVGISFDEAKKIAEEKVYNLGWDLELYSWRYQKYSKGILCSDETAFLYGYEFSFSRVLNDVPITYTTTRGGMTEDGTGAVDSTRAPWGYEICNVIVSKNGVEWVEIQNPYDIGQVNNKNVKMLDFEEIMSIYEQMFKIENYYYFDNENCKTDICIDEITLGYTRIYNPNVDTSVALLVPVWDFFGNEIKETYIEGEDTYWVTNTSHQSYPNSYMTINAIDGTIINRIYGY